MSRVLSHPNLVSSLGHEVLDCPEVPDQVEVRTYYPRKDTDALDYLHKQGALTQEVGGRCSGSSSGSSSSSSSHIVGRW